VGAGAALPVKGIVKSTAHKHANKRKSKGDTAVTINITEEQYEAMMAAIESRGRFYSFLFDNCGHFGMDVARAGGLPVGRRPWIERVATINPWIHERRRELLLSRERGNPQPIVI
jgi:hypothetical protein